MAEGGWRAAVAVETQASRVVIVAAVAGNVTIPVTSCRWLESSAIVASVGAQEPVCNKQKTFRNKIIATTM